MAFHADTTDLAEKVRSAEPWVWPMTAAIVIGGSVLFWSLAGLFWLAMHPAQQPVVIWMMPTEASADPTADSNPTNAAFVAENHAHAQTN